MKINLCHLLEEVLKLIPQGIILIDKNHYIHLANNKFKNIFNLSDEKFEGKKIEEIIKNEKLIKQIVEVIKNFKNEKKFEFSLEQNGKICYLLITINSLQVNKKTLYLILFEDITHIKRLENIRKEFVANVSHELKSPLTAIKGYVETLLEGDLKDQELAKKFLEIIDKQTQRFILLIEDLITLSRIEFGDIKIKKTYVSIEKLIDEVIEVFQEKAQQKGLYLKKEIKTNPEIYTDPVRMTQILINLIDNAIKFTKKGGVTVHFSKDGEYYVLCVEDTGIGIPKELIPRIGERFFRVDSSRSRKKGGTGLGMAIVKHLLQLLGYKWKIESRPKVGTKVKIYIPSKVNQS